MKTKFGFRGAAAAETRLAHADTPSTARSSNAIGRTRCGEVERFMQRVRLGD
jgi:hypothetical protein